MSCEFDVKGVCYAWACFSSSIVCGARDVRGNPKYAGNKATRDMIKGGGH